MSATDPANMRRFYWHDSNNFCCHGCYVVCYDEAFYRYGDIGRRPRHPTLVWVDEPPDWAKGEVKT